MSDVIYPQTEPEEHFDVGDVVICNYTGDREYLRSYNGMEAIITEWHNEFGWHHNINIDGGNYRWLPEWFTLVKKAKPLNGIFEHHKSFCV